MSVSLIGWGRWYTKDGRVTVPRDPALWTLLLEKVPELAQVGFDRLQLPPASKAQGGDGDGCDGYEVFDLRDLGDKSQQGSVRTHYGTADQLRALVARAHSYGIAVDLDLSLHQMGGGKGGEYRYLGSDGKTLNGRGAMHPGCFRKTAGGAGTQPEDAVPVPADDFPFGDEVDYENCDPKGYTIGNALEYGDWLFRTTGADGARFDDTKGAWAPFVLQFMTTASMSDKPFYSEYDDGNPANLNWWATSPPMNSRSGVEDFTLHYAVVNACNGYTARPLLNAGYQEWNPALSYPFVDNPDTDTSAGEGVIFNKLLGYARALTVPCREVLVYGKDYYGPEVWPGAYGLKPWVDNLVWINRTLAYGSETVRWCDDKLFVSERNGDGGVVGSSPGLLVGLNFDTYNNRSEWVGTSFGPHVHLHDYAGHGSDLWTNSDGWVELFVPCNAYSKGQSYVCYSVAGLDRPIAWKPRRTVQTFFGAVDLSIGQATPNQLRSIASIYVEGGTSVQFSTTDKIACTLVDVTGHSVGKSPVTTGWYSIAVQSLTDEVVDFTLAVTYQGA